MKVRGWFQELVLSFYYVCSRDLTQAISLVSQQVT